MEFASKIFIDGGDPSETQKADELLKKHGHPGVQGQTTNPSLIAKRYIALTNPDHAKKIPEKEAVAFYKKTVVEISNITKGPVSIQVTGDPGSMTTEQMLEQARERKTWIPNGVVKFPCTTVGLKAAEQFSQEGPVNITLTFTQEQAAAVYTATKLHAYDVFVSPFVGRLDNRGENGMDVVANISEMYKKFGDGHVKILTASVRNVKHILYALWLKSDAVTIPFKVFFEWAAQGFPQPQKDFLYDAPGLTDIPYRELSLDPDWREFDIRHDLTDEGLLTFWQDWKRIII